MSYYSATGVISGIHFNLMEYVADRDTILDPYQQTTTKESCKCKDKGTGKYCSSCGKFITTITDTVWLRDPSNEMDEFVEAFNEMQKGVAPPIRGKYYTDGYESYHAIGYPMVSFENDTIRAEEIGTMIEDHDILLKKSLEGFFLDKFLSPEFTEKHYGVWLISGGS